MNLVAAIFSAAFFLADEQTVRYWPVSHCVSFGRQDVQILLLQNFPDGHGHTLLPQTLCTSSFSFSSSIVAVSHISCAVAALCFTLPAMSNDLSAAAFTLPPASLTDEQASATASFAFSQAEDRPDDKN
jgi:hypothetical protein